MCIGPFASAPKMPAPPPPPVIREDPKTPLLTPSQKKGREKKQGKDSLRIDRDTGAGIQTGTGGVGLSL